MNTPAQYDGLRDFFQRHGAARQYAKGNSITAAETDPLGIFYIEAGFMKAFSHNTRGEQRIHVVYGPGDYFPLTWLARRVQRQLCYEALSPCLLRQVSAQDLQTALCHQPRLGLELLELAAEQSVVFLDRINNLQYRYARERLIYCLLYLAQRFGMTSGTGYEIILRISHQVIAGNVNLSRESVGREIDRLVRKGMVEVRSGHIVLLDMPGLVAELPGGVSEFGDWGAVSMSS